MLGALLWGISASMALAEENENANVKRVEEQLAKATEIIKRFSKFANNEIEYDP